MIMLTIVIVIVVVLIMINIIISAIVIVIRCGGRPCEGSTVETKVLIMYHIL